MVFPPRDSPAVRFGTLAVLSSRVAYGFALLVSPERVAAKRWLGEGARKSAAQVPLRPILAVSIAGDLADIGATAIARDGLPQGSAAATAAVAGGSLLLTAAIAALVDE